MTEDLPGLRFDKAGSDLQQRRLPGTVAADEADLVSGLHLQGCAGKQWRAAEAQKDVVEFQNGRRQRSDSGKIIGASEHNGAAALERKAHFAFRDIGNGTRRAEGQMKIGKRVARVLDCQAVKLAKAG